MNTRLFGLILVLGVFIASSSLASSFYAQPVPNSIRDAPVIVRGKAGASRSGWGTDPDGTKRIYTYTDIEPTEVFKGEASGNPITIRDLGGEMGDVGLHVPGASQYTKGEDIVVLLRERNGDGAFDVQGMMMGKFDVETTADGVEVLSGPALQGAASESWTVEKLRQTISDQGDRKPQGIQPVQEKNPKPDNPSPSPSIGAPPLQTSENNEPASENNLFLYLGICLFVSASGVAYFRLSRRRK